MSARDLEAARLREITQARLTLGPRHAATDTGSALAFALDHARAREAVGSELDISQISAALARDDLTALTVTSAAADRATFIRRPDLGRRLPPEAAAMLADNHSAPTDVALVLGDGLSAIAVALNGPAFMRALHQRLAARGLRLGPIVLAKGARVALGDGIARALGASTVVVALGERPGLSAADSLGVYITHAPGGFGDDTAAPLPDSARNCISNIRDAGLSVDAAAAQTEALILAMRRSGLSGVALNSAQQNALPE